MSKHVVIVGGSVAGLAGALALAQNGHRVTLLERDANPLPATPGEAFDGWSRRGSPQVRHSHAFLARLVLGLRERAPAFLDELFASGTSPMTFADLARPLMGEVPGEPGDEALTMLACRRLTFEWVLRRHVEARREVTFHAGVEVLDLVASRVRADAPLVVSGVRVQDASGVRELAADLVIDAAGRRSPLSQWLAARGVEVVEESEPCGIFYSSRFFRLHEGASAPAVAGFVGADLGYLKCGIFGGDARTFSVTVAASPEDDELACVQREAGFRCAASRVPAVAPWIDPAVAEPISRVHGMADLRNTRRFAVRDGEPIALGVVSLGDSLIHANPLNGRGCTAAFLHAWALADALRAHPADARAFALDLDARVSREIVPWYESTRLQDRDAIDVSAMQRRGEDPWAFVRADGTNDPRAYVRSLLRDGFFPLLREDATVMRAFLRIANMLEEPSDMLRRPDVMQRVLASWARRGERDPRLHGPTRAEMVAALRALPAAA